MTDPKSNVTKFEAPLRYGDVDLTTLADRVRRGEIPAEFAERVLAEAQRVIELHARIIDAACERQLGTTGLSELKAQMAAVTPSAAIEQRCAAFASMGPAQIRAELDKALQQFEQHEISEDDIAAIINASDARVAELQRELGGD